MNDSFYILSNVDKKFIEKHNIKRISIEEKLYSKKNDVYIIKVSFALKPERLYIYKEFKGEDKSRRLRREIYFYKEFYAPRLFYRGKSFIILEFLGRKNLLDYIEEKENKEYVQNDKSDLKTSLYEHKPLQDALGLIISFNSCMKAIKKRSYILGDMSFRNFILVSDRILRVDFEDCREGKIEEDAGKFIAFFLTYKPEFTEWKKQLAESIKNHCIYHLNMNSKLLEEEILKEFKSMKSRRR